jgi:crossover junction endodeoxyribonuclease RuvC
LQKNTKIILGIDPGTLLMGFGLIEITQNRVVLLDMNTLKISPKKDHYERLHLIHTRVQLLIGQYGPHELAIEAPFFGKNVQSMLKLGRAQGVAIAAAMQAGMPVTEYSPRKIKQSITGNGNAAKEQVWEMLREILHISQQIKQYDASDALAVALCHYFQGRTLKNTEKKLKGWGDFIANNPDRVKST